MDTLRDPVSMRSLATSVPASEATGGLTLAEPARIGGRAAPAPAVDITALTEQVTARRARSSTTCSPRSARSSSASAT